MFDGSSIEGFTRAEESDMYLYPDPYSKVIIMERSPKTGAYVFKEEMVPNDAVKDALK